MPDALPAQTYDDLPPALPYPVSISVRNTDLAIDESGNITRLSDLGLLLTMRSLAKPGTVLFSAINMRAMNATARGLIRVVWQRPLDDGMSVETYAEFVELSDDAKGKIQRLLDGGASPIASRQYAYRNFTNDQMNMQMPVPQRAEQMQPEPNTHNYFEPAPLRQQAKATTSTRFWGSLGVTAYVSAFLVVAAFFPAGRAFELFILREVGWSLSRMWYWANHIGDVKLYNNT